MGGLLLSCKNVNQSNKTKKPAVASFDLLVPSWYMSKGKLRDITGKIKRNLRVTERER